MYCSGSFVPSVLRMTDCKSIALDPSDCRPQDDGLRALSCPPEPVLSEVEVSGHLLFNEKVPLCGGTLVITFNCVEPITASSRLP